MRVLLLPLFVSVPAFAFAAGDGGGSMSTSPPQTTETTENCLSDRQWDPEIKKWVRFSQPVNGVWDPKVKKCIRPDKAGYLDSGLLMDAVRELAYAGRYLGAQDVLRAMADQSDDRVLTYWGFTHRKLGNIDLATTYYQQAIQQNPDNILARSYLGQGLVEEGDTEGAIVQWREIKARGGDGTWAEASLREAIRAGVTYSY